MAKSVTSAAPASAATLAASGEHYAIVVDGGRQYRVAEGQEFEIDFRPDKNCTGAISLSLVQWQRHHRSILWRYASHPFQ